jgi:tRNA(Ile)-lysidine synthase TilS/MesJ
MFVVEHLENLLEGGNLQEVKCRVMQRFIRAYWERRKWHKLVLELQRKDYCQTEIAKYWRGGVIRMIAGRGERERIRLEDEAEAKKAADWLKTAEEQADARAPHVPKE